MAPYRMVIEEAFTDEKLRTAASFEMQYVLNCSGGRPSDAARTAVRYVRAARDSGNAGVLASPTAQRIMAEILGKVGK